MKRLVVRPSSSNSQDIGNPNNLAKSVLVEVQFTGPQPSEGPGALLCDLLCGSSVDAQPVELPRGRKKRARVDATGSEASDSGELRYYCSSHNVYLSIYLPNAPSGLLHYTFNSSFN